MIHIYIASSVLLLFILSLVKNYIKNLINNAKVLQEEKDNLLKANSQYQSLLKESLPVLRLALKETHPDNGGNPHVFQEINKYYQKVKNILG